MTENTNKLTEIIRTPSTAAYIGEWRLNAPNGEVGGTIDEDWDFRNGIGGSCFGMTCVTPKEEVS